MSFHKIVSLEVDDGFLKGTKIDFAGHLTCVIGSRGSGKTTILEFLRYALNESIPPHVKKLIDKNLKPGRLQLVVEDAEGRRFVIERLCNEPPKVFEGKPGGRALVEGWQDIFEADVFTQADVAQVAEDQLKQRDLLDSFIAGELASLAGQRMTLERQLEQLVVTIKADTKAAAELIGVDEQITENAKQLEKLKPADPALDAAKAKAIAAQVHRKKEADLLVDLTRRLRDAEVLVRQATTAVAAKLRGVIPEEVMAGENAGLLRAVVDGVRATTEFTASSLDAIAQRLANEQQQAIGVQTRLHQAHAEQNVAADEVLRQDVAARERLTLEKQQADLAARLGQYRALQTSKRDALALRQRLVDDLAKVIDDRSAARRRQVKTLNDALEEPFGVHFVLKPGADTEALEERLDGALRGSNKRGQKEIVQRLVKLEPRTIGKHVLGAMRQALAKESGLTEDQASWVVGHLADHDDLLSIQATTNDDIVLVEFNVNGEWKPTQDLSTGQKCSAILPILMLQGERPLVADEPEGHLDQRTLVRRLVDQIKSMKGKRQIIVATHNPNIVTLGDAGDTAVVVLACDSGDRATLTQGSVDGMRREIETLLEGGKLAFQKRGDLYARP